MTEGIDFHESFFVNVDGAKLYRQIYQRFDGSIKCFVFLCHGLFEHCQSWYYESIIAPLRSVGCLVLTHDHYGHGRSDGPRGLIPNLDILIRDVLFDIEGTLKDLQLPENISIFLYGHSLGGLISVLASLQKKDYFKGLVLEAPALYINVNKAVIGILHFINHIYPKYKVKDSNPSHICRNEKHVEDIRKDKLQILDKISAMTLISVANAINLCTSHWKDFNSPVFIGQGDADKLCDPRGSQNFMKSIASTDKTLVMYPMARHRLRMETENVDLEFRNAVVGWIKERIN